MTRGIPKKRQRAEQLRKKRAQAAGALAGSLNPLRAIPRAKARKAFYGPVWGGA